MSASLACVFVLLTLPRISFSACHGSKTSYRAEFIGKLTIEDRVLVGHVIATFSVTNFNQCFGHCDEDCRCRSFNLPMSGAGECQLNSADNSTVLTKPQRGWRYHHLQVKEVIQGADTCYEPYSNGCCASNPCAVGTTCTELGDRGKPGFNCTCAHEYQTGPMCKRELNSCFDYLWHDKTASSGYYDIWEKDTRVKSQVYCDMRPDELEAWALVMSYGKTNNNEYESSPFYEDSPRNGIDPGSGDYRLSLAKMKSIQNGMTGGRAVEWRATCGYSFTNGHSTSEDVVRSAFETLDLFTFTTHEKGLVGYYPFDNVTAGEDKSGFGNDATLHDTVYEDGPLDNPGGSVRMSGDFQASYIELHDTSGMLDTRYSLTILMQVYPHISSEAQLLAWVVPNDNVIWGVHLWAFHEEIFFRSMNRAGSSINLLRSSGQIKPGEWTYLAATYDYENGRSSVYKNGVREKTATFVAQEICTQSNYQLTIGVVRDGKDNRAYNGRVACVKIYNTAFTDSEVKAFSENWECPHEPAPICHRVGYIKIRGRECYNCNVWATQTNTEIFSINAYRGDQRCNFNSGSTVPDENLFGVYKVTDGASHACASSDAATTQYWFGGRL